MKVDDLLEPPAGPPQLRRLAESADTETGVRRLRRGVYVVLLLAFVAFLVVGASRPADPVLEPVDALAPATEPASAGAFVATARPALEGYGQIAFRVVPGGGAGGAEAAIRCALLADNAKARARGMMERRDLAGHDAMVFRFEADSSSSFYMRNVPVALSVAWFDSAGRFVSATDMAPCENQDGCPLYPAAGDYRYAVEVLQGGLPALGIGAGSRLELGAGCTA